MHQIMDFGCFATVVISVLLQSLKIKRALSELQIS